jgi:hypothetical protein
VVVTDDPALLSLAAALASPIVALGPVTVAKGTSQGPLQRWAETYGVAVSDPTGLVGALGPTPAGETESRAQRLLDDAEGMLDALADAAATLQAAPKNPVQELADLRRQLRTVESANAGLRALLGRERAAFAALVPPAGPEVTGPASHPQSQQALREARQEVTRLRFELDALYATRTLRAVQPARRLYAKLRSRRT